MCPLCPRFRAYEPLNVNKAHQGTLCAGLSAPLLVYSGVPKRQKLPSGSLFRVFLNSVLSLGHKTGYSICAFFVPQLVTCQTLLSRLECMAGTTGLEPATSAVTVSR